MGITTNASEYKSKVGLDSLYIAEVTTDTAAAYAADAPEYLAPAASASQEPTSSLEIQYADDQPYDIATAEGPTKITLEVTGMPSEMLAKILGKKFDSTNGRLYDYGGTPPYIALSFRSQKSNGKYRYYQYLKGKFTPPKEETATKGEKPEPKTLELEFQAINTIHQFDLGGGITAAAKRVLGDEDTTNFSGTTWFSQVQTPVVGAVSALALSGSDPADDAPAIAVSKTITLTFNNALVAGAIHNVIVASAAGVAKACTNSLDATKKIMTVNPDTDLAGVTTYIVAIGVTDIYGQILRTALNFATA